MLATLPGLPPSLDGVLMFCNSNMDDCAAGWGQLLQRTVDQTTDPLPLIWQRSSTLSLSYTEHSLEEARAHLHELRFSQGVTC